MKHYKSITLSHLCGCGHIYAVFMEDGDKFYKVNIKGSMTKTDSPCGMSWYDAISSILTFALRRAITEGDDSIHRGLIKHLKYNTCDKRHILTAKSCSDAIGQMIEQYLRIKNKEGSLAEDYDETNKSEMPKE